MRDGIPPGESGSTGPCHASNTPCAPHPEESASEVRSTPPTLSDAAVARASSMPEGVLMAYWLPQLPTPVAGFMPTRRGHQIGHQTGQQAAPKAASQQQGFLGTKMDCSDAKWPLSCGFALRSPLRRGVIWCPIPSTQQGISGL